MKTIMKILNWIGWISTVIGVVWILLGIIAILTPDPMFLGINEIINFFHAANSFLLLAIALFIITKKYEYKSE